MNACRNNIYTRTGDIHIANHSIACGNTFLLKTGRQMPAPYRNSFCSLCHPQDKYLLHIRQASVKQYSSIMNRPIQIKVHCT
jgi:hypothetical protein